MSFITLLFILGASTAIACSGSNECEKEVTIESVTGLFEHAEGLHWNHRSQRMFFVDIDQQMVWRLDPATTEVTSAYVPNGPVGFVIPVADRPYRFVAGAGRDFVLIVWNDKSNNSRPTIETLATVDNNHPGNRWNDGKADSHGRFWGGTIGPEMNNVVVPNQASLYRIDTDLELKTAVSPVTNSNGLIWNIEDNIFYYIDTPTRQIAAYDFDANLGVISNKRIVFDFAAHGIEGLPDGMTIDDRGNLWVAMYNNGTVRNVDPTTGELLRTIEIPATKVTTVAFGGPLMDTLYTATSGRDLSAEERKKTPHAGSIFAVKNLGVRGLISNEFRMEYSAPKSQ